MLEQAERNLSDQGFDVCAVTMDVTNAEDWVNLADKAEERFGNIHMLVNNAGVASKPGTVEQTDMDDWRWVLDVNLLGVVQGAATLVPRIKRHGEGGCILNVASMAGMAGVPLGGPYTATKVAVVGMSEAWRGELAEDNIHVAVLCPGYVKSRIHLSARNRNDSATESLGAEELAKLAGVAAQFVENGIDTELVGRRVVEALELGEHYIYTHPNYRPMIQHRSDEIDQAFARAAESKVLAEIDDFGPTGFA
jgi:NAD(P)-dependent dehydrogenase (short-subunit alcohol dehydrogenase family)